MAAAELARELLEIQSQINVLTVQLDAKKDEMREIANGNKMVTTVEGVGIVSVTAPREGSEKLIIVLDEDRLTSVPDLKAKLMEKAIIKEEIKKSPPAKASVTIKLNV